MLYYLPQYKTTTLNVAGGIDNSQTTGIVMQDVTGIDITLPGIVALNYAVPLDTTKVEYIKYKSINGSNELVGVTRGAESSSAKTHVDQVTVGFVLSASHINNINTALTTGLIEESATCTYSSTTEFTIVGDVSDIYTAGRVVRFNSATEVGLVSSSSYSSPNTTVVVASAIVPTPITKVEYGVQPYKKTDFVDLTTAQTLTNKTLTSPKINEDVALTATATELNLTAKNIVFQVVDGAVSTSTGDGKAYFTIPEELNGMNLVGVHARVITAGTTNTTDIQIRNVTDSADMLSTKMTIDSTETSTATAAAAAVIDAAKDDVATNDLIAIDVDAVSTTAAKGLIVRLRFELP